MQDLLHIRLVPSYHYQSYETVCSLTGHRAVPLTGLPSDLSGAVISRVGPSELGGLLSFRARLARPVLGPRTLQKAADQPLPPKPIGDGLLWMLRITDKHGNNSARDDKDQEDQTRAEHSGKSDLEISSLGKPDCPWQHLHD